MDIRIAFGRRIKTLREYRGLTQQDLAEALGRSVDAVSMIERGKNWPSVATIDKLSAAMNVSVADLFNDLTDGSERRDQDAMAVAKDALGRVAKSDLPVAVAMLQAMAKKQRTKRSTPSKT